MHNRGKEKKSDSCPSGFASDDQEKVNKLLQLVFPSKIFRFKDKYYNSLNAILLVRHCYIWTPKDFQKVFFIIMIFIPYPKTHVGIALYTTKMWVSRRDIFRFPLISSTLTESNTVRR